jgi:hypothetical protein
MSTKSNPSAGGKSKMGRPTIYSDDLAARICAELACGKSLRTVCKADDMPGLETVFRWLRQKPDFRDQYAHAKGESTDALFEQLFDIADDASGDVTEDDEGRAKVDYENIQRSKLRVDVRKWALSKLAPKKYGNKLDLSHGVQPDDPLGELIRGCMNTPLPLVRNPAND